MVGNAVRGIFLVAVLFADGAPAKDVGITVDPALVAGPAGEPGSGAPGAAWLLYGLAKAGAYEQTLKSGAGNGTPDDFAVEVAGRKALAAYWREARADKSQPADAYLDKLVAIDDGGFLEEYVLATFAAPGWVVPATALTGLDLRGFMRWGETNVAGLESPSPDMVRVNADKAHPVVPGDDLPDAEEYSPGRRPCAEALPPLRQAVAAWDGRAGQLAGTPVAAEERGHFLAALAAIGGREPARTKGVVWISMRPAQLAFVAGYCAVDIGDYSLAEGLLRTAVALLPVDGSPRMELAQALIGQGKLDQADALVTEILEATTDPCAVARAWRKRGFIRFEQGLLVEARAAYRKSQEFEPDSPLAKSELQALDAEILRTGGKGDDYQPPPQEQMTTTCGQ